MNFLKTTALSLIVCLGLVPTVYSAFEERDTGAAAMHTLHKDAATGEEGQGPQAARLTHHQMLQLKSTLAHWDGFPVDSFRAVHQFVTGAGMSFPEDQAYAQFDIMQHTLLKGIGSLNERVTLILGELGFKAAAIDLGQFKTARGAGLMDRTMDIITFIGEQEGADAIPLNAFKRFLATELLFGTEGASLPQILSFLGIEVEPAARVLSASKFRELAASFGVQAQKSIPVRTGLLIDALGDLVGEADKAAFNRLLKAQLKKGKKRATPEIGEFVKPLGVSEEDLAGIPAAEGAFGNFKEQMDNQYYYSLPVLEKTRRVLDALTAGGKVVDRDTLEGILKEASLGEEDVSAKAKAASVLAQLLNANLVVAEGAEEAIKKAVTNADKLTDEARGVLGLLMNGTVRVRHPENVMVQDTAAPYYKLLAVQDALNRSSGTTGLKTALGLLGIAISDAPKAASPSRPSSALSQLRRSQPTTPGSAHRFGYSPSRPQSATRPTSAGVSSYVSDELKAWAAAFAENRAAGAPDFRRPEEPVHMVPASFGAGVTKDLEADVAKDQLVPPSMQSAPTDDVETDEEVVQGANDADDHAAAAAPLPHEDTGVATDAPLPASDGEGDKGGEPQEPTDK